MRFFFFFFHFFIEKIMYFKRDKIGATREFSTSSYMVSEGVLSYSNFVKKRWAWNDDVNTIEMQIFNAKRICGKGFIKYSLICRFRKWAGHALMRITRRPNTDSRIAFHLILQRCNYLQPHPKYGIACDSWMFRSCKQYVPFIMFTCIVSSRWQQTLPSLGDIAATIVRINFQCQSIVYVDALVRVVGSCRFYSENGTVHIFWVQYQ